MQVSATDTPQSATAAGPLMLDLAGPEATEAELELLSRPAVGGVILFSRNYRDLPQLQALTACIRRRRPELIIAVDHEGGRVQRFRDGFTVLPPMAAFGPLYASDPHGARQLARDTGWLLASELIACGIDISFTPVLDLDRSISEVIGDRSFGAEPQRVIDLAGAMIDGMHEAGMAATGKHFPGHGGVAADSHVALPEDERSFDQIQAQDLQPFASLAGHDLDAVMPAHVIYSRCDSRAAGFSPFWLQQVLRRQLGFDGVIFSDDLSMEGAVVAGSYPERAEAALTAGCDMVLVCNQPEAAVEVLEWLEAQAQPPSARIGRMKARSRIDLQELQASERWHRTRRQLQTLKDLES